MPVIVQQRLTEGNSVHSIMSVHRYRAQNIIYCTTKRAIKVYYKFTMETYSEVTCLYKYVLMQLIAFAINLKFLELIKCMFFRHTINITIKLF